LRNDLLPIGTQVLKNITKSPSFIKRFPQPEVVAAATPQKRHEVPGSSEDAGIGIIQRPFTSLHISDRVEVTPGSPEWFPQR
jgi:D-serine deaminase-like pyridoxal phosphate-dependent protein